MKTRTRWAPCWGCLYPASLRRSNELRGGCDFGILR